ncbi:hemopexin repeat-containing protein [Pontiellaceae bacterium B12219]|nr:hemopexin repeat-containing protein [Pontiellaceae bacterium B12219]
MKLHRYIWGLLLASVIPVSADYRLWEGKDGSAIEAEFVAEVGDAIVLKLRDKSTIRVSKLQLSDADVSYVEITHPPELKIALTKNESRDFLAITAGCNLLLQKMNSRAYAAPITVKLFTIGYNRKSSDQQLLLDSKSWSYDALPEGPFSDEKNYGKRFFTQNLSNAPNRSVPSIQVSGYAVKVFDAKGMLIAQEESSNRLIKDIESAWGCPLEEAELEDFEKTLPENPLKGGVHAAVSESTSRITLFNNDRILRFDTRTHSIDRITEFGKHDWEGIPDAFSAIANHSDQKLYFFFDGSFRSYNKEKHEAEKAVENGIEQFEGIPAIVDAATYINKSTIVFFADDTCYHYDCKLAKVTKTSPFGSPHWKGLPVHIDAAATAQRGIIYFFAGDKYYRFNIRMKQVEAEGKMTIDGWPVPEQEVLAPPRKPKVTEIQPIPKVRKEVPAHSADEMSVTLEEILQKLAATQKDLRSVEGDLVAEMTLRKGKPYVGNLVGRTGNWIEFKTTGSTKPLRIGASIIKYLNFKIWLDVKVVRKLSAGQEYGQLRAYLQKILIPYEPYKDIPSNLDPLRLFAEEL